MGGLSISFAVDQARVKVLPDDTLEPADIENKKKDDPIICFSLFLFVRMDLTNGHMFLNTKHSICQMSTFKI